MNERLAAIIGERDLREPRMTNQSGARAMRWPMATALALAVFAANTAALGIATIGLSLLFAACAGVWASRRWRPVPGLFATALATTIALALHFAEELFSGFAESFPALFGASWTVHRFVEFNLTWLGVFALCTFFAAREVDVAFLGLVFLALGAGVANGIGHVMLSVGTGRIFPGTYSAPLVLVSGIMLWRALRRGSVTGTIRNGSCGDGAATKGCA